MKLGWTKWSLQSLLSLNLRIYLMPITYPLRGKAQGTTPALEELSIYWDPRLHTLTPPLETEMLPN